MVFKLNQHTTKRFWNNYVFENWTPRILFIIFYRRTHYQFCEPKITYNPNLELNTSWLRKYRLSESFFAQFLSFSSVYFVEFEHEFACSKHICQSCSKRHCNEVSYHLPSKKSFSIKVHVKFSSLKTQVKSNKTNKIYAQEISVSTFEMPWVWSFSRGNSLGSTRFLHGKYCRGKWMALKSLR